MVTTVKFSQFSNADPADPTNTVVGLGNGANVIEPKEFSWTTSTRPFPPFNGLFGYNTDLSQYEFYDLSALQWVQILTTNSGGLDWSEITVASIDANVNNGYITNRTVTPVNILLPAIFRQGEEVAVMGLGAGGWSLIANSGQNIVFGSLSTSVAGAINSDITNSNIFVRGLVDNTTWTVTVTNSNPQII